MRSSSIGKENGATMISGDNQESSSGRRTLQVLHENSASLFRKDSADTMVKKPKGLAKSFNVFLDGKKDGRSIKSGKRSVLVAVVNSCVQTDLSGDQSDLSPDLDFYKELAEKRRLALDMTLKENEDLVARNDSLETENRLLAEQNRSLLRTVAEAHRISELLGPILEDHEEVEDDDDDDGVQEQQAQPGDDPEAPPPSAEEEQPC